MNVTSGPRQWYETADHRRREREIADKAARCWSCELLATKPGFAADMVARRNRKVGALVEIKDRVGYSMHRLDSLGGLMVSAAKWGNVYTLAQVLRLPTVVIAETAGPELWFHKATKQFTHDGVDIKGRVDRGDWQDVEPVVLFRRRRWHRLVEGPPPFELLP